MQSTITRSFLVAGSTALVLGLAGCAASGGYSPSAPGRSSSLLSPSDMGQMSSQGTPQGESGTPHTHDPAATAASRVQDPRAGTSGGSSGLSPSDMGQMGSQGTPQGESGTPHRH